jgi:PAS domain S-box-containing protein
LVALVSAAVAILVRWVLDPQLGDHLQLLTLYGAAAVAVWFGGWGAGVLAAILAFIGATLLFILPRYGFSPSLLAALVGYSISCGIIIYFGEMMRRANARLKREVQERETVEQGLAEEKELLVTTLASIGDAVIVTDASGHVTSLNSEAQSLTGWKQSEAVGQPLSNVFRIINELSRQPAENPVETALRSGTVTGLANHTMLLSKDGREIPIDDSAAPIRRPGGPLLGVVLVFRNVTEQHQAQQARARLAAIVEFSGDAMATKNLDGVIQTWNAAAERLFGYRADEIIGQSVTMLIPPDRLGEEERILSRLRRGLPAERLETVRRAKDGRLIPVSVSVSPLKDNEGRVIGASTVIHDITEIAESREALVQEKELLATTLGSIGDGVIVTDETGRITFINAEARRMTGWKEAEAAGRPLPEVFRIINELTRQPTENPVEKVLRLGRVVGLANHTILLAKNGREIPIDDSAAPIRNPDGPIFGVVLVFRDATEQRKAQETHARLAAIIEFSGDAIVTKNLDGVIQTWNAAAERLFGYRPDEIIGQPVTVLIPPDRLEEEERILSRLRRGLPAERLETLRRAKDGRLIPVSVSVSPLKDSEGRVIGASKVVHDITEIVESREALFRDKQLLAATLSSIGDGVIVTDGAGRVTFINGEASRMTGYKETEAIGRLLSNIFPIVNELTRQPVENPVEKVLRLGRVVGLANHTILLAKGGREIPIDDSAAPIRESGGPIFGVVLVFRDATEQRKAQDTYARLAAIVEFSGDAIATKNLDGVIQTWNSAAEQLFGYRAEEIIGKPVTTLIPPDRLEEEEQVLSRLRRGLPAERFETLRVTKDGRQIPVSVSVSPVKDRAGQVVGASKVIHDISERKQRERQLAEQARLLDLSYDAIIVRDPQERITYWNEGAFEAYGYARERVLGQPIHELLGTEFPEPLEQIRDKLNRDGRWTGELVHKRKDGSRIVVASRWSLARDAQGNPVSILETNTDITERKRIEAQLRHHREALERTVAERTGELRQSVRTLEELLYTIAHDLRAPNRAMQGYSHLLEAEYGSELDETAADYLRRISAAALRNDALIHDLLEFGRLAHQDVPVTPLDSRRITESVVEEVQAEARKCHATIEISSGDWPVICANATLLKQILGNLLNNAIKYRVAGREPRIELAGARDDGYGLLFVKDNGPGIPPESYAKIFEPFTRLGNAAQAEGTGIGLAIVRKAAERMDGKAGVKSNPGDGSCFWVQLPLAPSKNQPEKKSCRK